MRAREQDPREPIPNSEWSFGVCEQGQPPTPDDKHVCYPPGFQPGRLYELIYRAKDPTVGGLGFAAARDLGAFLRNSAKDDSGAANPVYRADNLAIIEGCSQSGRMIRSFLALGFNRDETGGRVFDGAYPHIGGGLCRSNVRVRPAGARLGRADRSPLPRLRFSVQPTRAKPTLLTKRTQGLFDRCAATGHLPRLFHVATALEMWEARHRSGSTDPLGRCDVADPPDVRTYIMASTQHGAAPLPLADARAVRQLPAAAQPQPAALDDARAADSALAAWVRDGARRRQRDAAHRRRHARPAGSGPLSRDPRECLWRRGAARGTRR